MKTSLINIGRKKAVIISEDFLERCNIIDKAFIEIENGSTVIGPDKSYKRKGWDSAFMEMARNGDDELIISDFFKDENFDNW